MKIDLYYQFKPRTAFILQSAFLAIVFGGFLLMVIWGALNDPKSWDTTFHTSATLGCVLFYAGMLAWTIGRFLQNVGKVPTDFAPEP